MKYSIETRWIRQQAILVKNETQAKCLCRVDVNHQLFKIIYLEAQSVVELPYGGELAIDTLHISQLDH